MTRRQVQSYLLPFPTLAMGLFSDGRHPDERKRFGLSYLLACLLDRTVSSNGRVYFNLVGDSAEPHFS